MNDSEYKTMVRGAFDQASQGYDSPAMRFFDNSAAHLVDSLPLTGSEHVLDVATGTGKLALRLAERLHHGRVLGVDLSDGMLARAREKAAGLPAGRLEFQCADIDAATLPAHHFDGITCGFGVFFWPDMEATLRSVLRLLKPGGFLAITSFADGSFTPLANLCLARFEKFGVQLPKTYTWEKLDDPSKHRDLLQRVGVADITAHTAPMGYHLANPQEWWDVVYYSGFRGFLNQLSAEDAARYKQEHLEEIATQMTPAGIPLRVDVIFTIARVPGKA